MVDSYRLLLLMDIVIQNVTGTTEKPLGTIIIVSVTIRNPFMRTLMVYVFKIVVNTMTITTKILMSMVGVQILVMTRITTGTKIIGECVF